MEHQDEMNRKFFSKEFLADNSLTDNEGPAIYSLEDEFAKTKRNRDLKPRLVVSGFIALLIGLTWATVNYLERQSRLINIDISHFEDLRLKEALNEAMAVSSDLEVYQYALQMLLKEKNAAGCVLDPRQADSVLVFLNQRITAEIIVDLYRSEDAYVGKIKLVPDKNGVRAETVEVAENERVKPLDWFRLPER